ncbi:hypothetical protein PIB30_000764 [Stylosanthes scabra]|uniref:Uncharacterized protein n=1 Tax=Stylosanthes scabra TaxID=79078 RepID=A0ABU6Q261_9FABA|nr:hypothetical protein [Stylosanthes scabra]
MGGLIGGLTNRKDLNGLGERSLRISLVPPPPLCHPNLKMSSSSQVALLTTPVLPRRTSPTSTSFSSAIIFAATSTITISTMPCDGDSDILTLGRSSQPCNPLPILMGSGPALHP